MLVPLTHDPLLVVLSTCLAVAASFTGLDLAARARMVPPGPSRWAWLAAAGLATGGGIWSMHVIGLFALGLPSSTAQAVGLACIAFVLPVAFSGAALSLGTTPGRPVLVSVAGGLLMAAGSLATLYAWMPALDASGWPPSDLTPVLAALPVALTSAVAIAASRGGHGFAIRLLAACALGVSLSVMHVYALGDVRVEARALDATPGYPALAVAASTLILLVAGIAASVSDRQFATSAAREAEALRLSEERYVSLYRHSPLPLHSLRLDGTIEQVSDAWLHLLDWTREEVIGRPLTDFMDAASASRRVGTDWPLLLGSGRLDEAEYRLVRRDGTMLDVLLSAQAEPNPRGTPERSLEGLVDVTQRRAAETALRQAQKMEAIGQLTGGIAHDFNNLLTVFSGGLDIINKGRRPPHVMEAMQRSVERAASLTRQLLTFSRTQTLAPEVVDIGLALTKVRGMLGQILPPDMRLVTQVEPGLWRCEIDPNQFEVAILNMVINARDAMPSGGRVEVSARNEVLGEDGGPRGEFVSISVRDEGIGIPPDVLARVFEPFFTTKEPGRGTGLGLSQVYGWTRQSGGDISVESQVGQGTTFVVRFPRTLKAPVDLPATPLPEDPGYKGLVLLVEDTPAVAGVAATMLHELGYDVVVASDAQEALTRLAEAGDVAAVFTDIVMPGPMNGIGLARELRHRRPGLPVLLATGYSREADESGRDLGLRVLRKPYQITELARALDAVVGEASAARPAA